MLRLAYYAVAARRSGVPEMWVQDAVQDIALACWLANDDRAFVVNHRAIDAARRYGAHNRRGGSRETVSLEDRHEELILGRVVERRLKIEVADPVNMFASVDRVLDFRAAWALLTRVQRGILARSIAGRRDVSYRRVHDVRKRLRELAA